MIQDVLKKLLDSRHLSEEEAAGSMTEIMEGRATDAQIGAFLVALQMKGETVDEISGCAKVMREKATRIEAGAGPVVDTCGTGGDVSHTFNISTAAALIVAGAGIKVAKHGNRSVSSKCGSADVLAALGVNIEADVRTVENCIREAGLGFMFAPLLHSAMKYAIGPRKELGVRTIFNLLGPLTNPAGARHQLLGVFAPGWTEPLARVLGQLGSRHALVVHGLGGLDEISIGGPTRVSEWKGHKVLSYEVHPEQFGLPQCSIEELKVESAEESAGIIQEILSGKEGPPADIAVLNAGAAIYAADVADSIAGGIASARESLGAGAARRALQSLIDVSNGNSGE